MIPCKLKMRDDLYTHIQGDHKWSMKSPEVLADLRATRESMRIFSNSLDHNESIFKIGKNRRNGRPAYTVNLS